MVRPWSALEALLPITTKGKTMPKFAVQFVREVLAYDLIEREIEAESYEAAADLAAALASQFDGETPNDFQAGESQAGRWEVLEVETL
jgi:hypothetical protein